MSPVTVRQRRAGGTVGAARQEGTIDTDIRYRENGATWRPLGVTAAAWCVGVALDAALGTVHWAGWLLALLAAGGVVAVGTYARQRFGTVIVDPLSLRVGPETVPLSRIDTGYLGTDSNGGAPVGARVVGGATAVPKGRVGLPVRLHDGSMVLVPCRDPERLRQAIIGE